MSLSKKFQKLVRSWKQDGFEGVFHALEFAYKEVRDKASYRQFVRNESLSKDVYRRLIGQFSSDPLISVILPVYNVEEKYLRLCLDSVLNQFYENWELCIADDKSPSPHIKRVLDEYASRDERIKVVYREKNGHISAASNSALEMASGEFCVLLDHDDELAPHALFHVAKVLNERPDTAMIYSDEDLIDKNGRRFDPKFKPDFARDLFYSGNLVTHLSAYRTSLLREIGGFRVGMEGSQDYDLALRVIERIDNGQIVHIPEILYHWRVIEGSVALSGDEKPYAHDAARRAIGEHLARIGKKARVEPTEYNLHRVRYELPENLPKVALIISGSRTIECSEKTIEHLIDRTDYPNLEIISIDATKAETPPPGSVPDTSLSNPIAPQAETRPLGSVPDTSPSNPTAPQAETRPLGSVPNTSPQDYDSHAEYLNRAATQTDAEILCFFKSGLKPLNKDWLKEMVSFAIQEETGAVGAKILDRAGTIAHGGLIIGGKHGVSIAHHRHPSDQPGNISRAQLIGNFSAVSAACMAIKRKDFEELKGFNGEDFPENLFDADLCLRLLNAGKRNMFTPYAEIEGELILGSTERERLRFHEVWGEQAKRDRFYSEHLSPESGSIRLKSI
ncbi:MAG: glycosyltransferase [Pyrinomonadaceae bacterium]|nr:glycosyltransferase [Pyrinomonadaceae bacterium]